MATATIPGTTSGPSMRRPIGVKMVLCSYLWILTFSPSRLCRHPSIRSLWWALIARCQLGVLDTVGAATW